MQNFKSEAIRIAKTASGRITWVASKVRTSLLTLALTVWNITSNRSVTSPHSMVDVSMTTYGARTAGSYLTIESIGIGKSRPRRLILWIDELEVLADPPAQLRRLMKRGLEILPCENTGPHKKYYPYVKDFADSCQLLVTADDDVFYPKWWLSDLIKSYESQPGDVVGYRLWSIKSDKRGYAPYTDWCPCLTTESSLQHFATGVSGVLYDRRMVQLLQREGDKFMAVCPRADDVWLHFVAISSGIPVRQVNARPSEFSPRLRTSSQGLAYDNVSRENDIAIAATAELFAGRS